MNRAIWVAAVLAALATAILYPFLSWREVGFGYPLDDAWIHQTYARNLAENGEWAFTAGTKSAGSTAPLWSAWISIGYFLRLNPTFWTYLSGLILLVISGWLGARWYADRYPEKRHLAWVLAALIPLEWHLAWASMSGMETLAVGALALLCFFLLERKRTGPFVIGLLIGGGLWLRPDVLTLAVAPLGYFVIRDRESRLGRWLALGAGLLIPIAGYLLFQQWLSGEFWPNTLYAKQAEYAVQRQLPLLARLLTQLGVPGRWLGQGDLQGGGPIVGVLLALLPGLIITIGHYLHSKNWTRLIPLAWVAIYIAAYAVQLPVTYQHGRYAIPVIPVLLVLSFEGMTRWIRSSSENSVHRVVSRAWILLVVVSGLAFWLIGAGAYRRDVAIIESEMVATARWIAENTGPQSLIAAHDIGAIGYYTDRELLDLAGLISPEVIPFIRDEAALATYLDRSGANYLVTFPGWYPNLTADLPQVFITAAPYSPSAGGENMAVFVWD